MSNKVSIITRTKNRPILLKRAFKSIAKQSFENWEWIIVNDGGNQIDIDEILSQIPMQKRNKTHVIHNEHSLGMEAASNIGLKKATGTYIAIHDDDDSWHLDFLQKTTNFLDNNFAVKGVITHSQIVNEEITKDNVVEVGHKEFNTDLNGIIELWKIARHNLFPPISFVYHRSILDKIGYYNEAMPVLGDWEFNLRFVADSDIAVLPEVLANWHHRLDASADYSNTVIARRDEHIRMAEQLRNSLLRDDINIGKIGLGYLINHSHNQMIEQNKSEKLSLNLVELNARLNELDNKINHISGMISPIFNMLKKIYYPFKIIKKVLFYKIF